MKRTFIIIILAAITIFSFSFAAFGADLDSDVYNDEAWSSKELPIIFPIDVKDMGVDKDFLFEEGQSFKEPEKWVYDLLGIVKEDIYNYFYNQYDIDVEKKLKKLEKIYVFSGGEIGSEKYYITGFINDNNEIRINEEILRDPELLESNLVHEIIHYLGVRDPSMNYISEGLTEVLSTEVMENAGKIYYSTDYYAIPYFITSQMILADRSLVRRMIEEEDFSLSNYINQKLSNDLQTYNYVDNLALELEACLGMFVEKQYASDEEEFLITLQAQVITIAFCRSFSPEDYTREAIRNNYILVDAEMLFS